MTYGRRHDKSLSACRVFGGAKDRLLYCFQRSAEKMVGGFHPVQLLRSSETLVHAFQLGPRAVLVLRALDENLGRGAPFQLIRRTPSRGEARGHHKARARALAAEPQDDARPEG